MTKLQQRREILNLGAKTRRNTCGYYSQLADRKWLSIFSDTRNMGHSTPTDFRIDAHRKKKLVNMKKLINDTVCKRCNGNTIHDKMNAKIFSSLFSCLKRLDMIFLLKRIICI